MNTILIPAASPSQPLYPEPPLSGRYALRRALYTSHLPDKFAEIGPDQILLVEADGKLVPESRRPPGFVSQPLPFLREWLAQRRQGHDFSYTPMGYLCHGRGCPVCKHSGWIEMGGAGVVDPNVLEAVGYDPEEWQGFAFGLGIDRIAFLRHGLPDLRLFWENDLRMTRQF